MLHGSVFIMKTAKMPVNKIFSPQIRETFMALDVGNNARWQLTGQLHMNRAPCLPDVNMRKGETGCFQGCWLNPGLAVLHSDFHHDTNVCGGNMTAAEWKKKKNTSKRGRAGENTSAGADSTSDFPRLLLPSLHSCWSALGEVLFNHRAAAQ